ncbi:MAG: serine hydrolase [Hyphomonadaceae bacterium]|nr:serine hydrolase [Hyphomonadaceae bacterium]
MHRLIAAACLLLTMAAAPAWAQLVPLRPHPEGVPWPTADWSVAAPAGVDAAGLAAAMSDAFDGKIPALGETREVVIVQNGRLVYERYAPGYTPQTRLVSWSVAKSVTHALVGVAAAQGRIDPDAPMGSPHWAAGDGRAALSWRTWLNMVDGQRYLEIGAPSVTRSDAARKLFGPGRLDVARWCAGLPMIHAPGAVWNYNSCGIVLTADALTRTVFPAPADAAARRAAMLRWMREGLFDRIGMKTAQPEFDQTGLFYGSALIYAPAREFAKFGYLYLRDGVWDGRRILPEGWVDFARTPGPAANTDGYGAGWWLNPATGPGKPRRVLMDAGRDGFSAQGHEGQIVLVIPSRDLVIVRMGLIAETPDAWDALYDWVGRVGALFPEAAAPPA